MTASADGPAPNSDGTSAYVGMANYLCPDGSTYTWEYIRLQFGADIFLEVFSQDADESICHLHFSLKQRRISVMPYANVLLAFLLASGKFHVLPTDGAMGIHLSLSRSTEPLEGKFWPMGTNRAHWCDQVIGGGSISPQGLQKIPWLVNRLSQKNG